MKAPNRSATIFQKPFSSRRRSLVNNTVVLQQQTPILELATLSQNFRHEYEWTNTRLGSTKKIKIKGSFEAKAGFDLNKRFALEITEDKASGLPSEADSYCPLNL
jgi:hypothetical protein